MADGRVKLARRERVRCGQPGHIQTAARCCSVSLLIVKHIFQTFAVPTVPDLAVPQFVGTQDNRYRFR
jgi:hypothetical protein